ncbi:PLD nuclease N-terminal domain-containing protein [Jeotgalibacillus proteolyticus]|uniref:PLD nuclease N-terminal domain-containing protein n=1 Tax=Jeotgalibacillus proteolyticus TaxID=2082395 RepID=UPI003CE94BF6
MENFNLAVIAPLLIISLLLAIIALVDVIKRPSTNGPKILWVLCIVLISTIGPILYFIFGRKET